MDRPNECLVCNLLVGRRQEALQCDVCERWQHRICGMGIDRATYRRLVRGEETMDWHCRHCTVIEVENPSYMGDAASVVNEEAMDPADDNANQPPVMDPAADSFHVDTSFDIPVPVIEENRADDSALSDAADAADYHGPLTYSIVEEGSQRKKRKLVDSIGYAYTLKREHRGKETWVCSVRSKSARCPANVFCQLGIYVAGQQQHNHSAVPGLLTSTQIKAAAKTGGRNQVFASATTIIETIYSEMVDLREPEGSRPNPRNLARAVQRDRPKSRPDEPKDLNFEMDVGFLPANFLRSDIRVGDERHVIFASDAQLGLLASAKTWYIDGTFKVVRKPFYQLLGIHTFVRYNNDLKQVPVLFCLMSSRRKRDYKKVLKSVLRLLPGETSQAQEFVCDFEAALWQALRSVFPNASIKGCVFHLTQAIWRRAQELGLQCAYSSNQGVFKFVRNLMALPFLPAEHITEAFRKISAKAADDKTKALAGYMERTWIDSTIWQVADWCVFTRLIRTNNDVEGYHRRLNDRVGTKRPINQMIMLLNEEAEKIPIQVRLISEGKLRRRQTKKTKSVQGRIFALWKDYADQSISTHQLLQKVGRLYGPAD